MVADKQFDVIFCSDLKRAVDSSELALDVLLRGRTWQKAIDENWRKTKSWQPGWEYEY
jgi:broad specificity phosphatase PhoE